MIPYHDIDMAFVKRLTIIHSIDVPVAQLTVQDICDKCGISRQTFYRYFESKDEMFDWIGFAFRRETVEKIGTEYTWQEGYERLLELLYSEKQFFVYLTSVDYMHPRTINCYREGFLNMLRRQGVTVTKRLDFAAQAQAILDLKLTYQWCKDGMKDDIKELAANLAECVPRSLYEALTP